MECIIDCEAIIKNPVLLPYVKNITYDLVYKIVEKNGMNLEYIPEEHITYDIIKLAINSNKFSIGFVKEQTDEYHEIFMKHYDGYGFELLVNPSYDIYKRAIEINPTVIKYIQDKVSIDLRIMAIDKNINNMFLLKNLHQDEKEFIMIKDYKYKIFFDETDENEIESIILDNEKWFICIPKKYYDLTGDFFSSIYPRVINATSQVLDQFIDPQFFNK